MEEEEVGRSRRLGGGGGIGCEKGGGVGGTT